MKVGVYIENSVEAVEFYKKVFNLELGYNVKNSDGSYYHSELYKDGEEILNVIESKKSHIKNTNVQLSIELKSDDEVKRAYELLCDGGIIDLPIGPLPWSPCAASVIDKFGIWWYISTCSHYPEKDFVPEENNM